MRGTDRGHALACRVSATNPAGTAGALSNAILVPNAPKRVASVVAITIDCAICKARVALRLTRDVRRAIIRSLRAGRAIVATLGVRIVDSAGKRGSIVRRVPLRL